MSQVDGILGESNLELFQSLSSSNFCVILFKGKLVWFDASFGYFIPGEIVDRLSPKCLVVQSDYFGLNQLFEVKSNESVLPRSSDSLVDIDDMICLNELNEASMLWNLKLRYEKNLIYVCLSSSFITATKVIYYLSIYKDIHWKYINSRESVQDVRHL